MRRSALALATLTGLLWLIAPARADNPYHLQKLLDTKECAKCNLSNARLRGLDLSNANLVGANLAGADLRGSILVGADLTLANLQRARLNGAILNGANLSGTDMKFADLSNASLLRVNLDMWGGVELTGAKLNSTMMPDGSIRDENGKIRPDDFSSRSGGAGVASPASGTGRSVPPVVDDNAPRQPSIRIEGTEQ